MRPLRRGVAAAGVAAALAAAASFVVPASPAAAQVGGPMLPGLGGPCDVPLIGAVCAVPRAIGGVAGAVAGLPASVADNVIEGLATWIASGAASFVESAGKAIFSGTQPRLSGTGEGGRAWFVERYDDMALVALGLFVPMLILAVLHGVLSQSAAMLWRAVANLPVAALGTVVAVVVVEALLGATDNASAFVARGLGADTGNVLSGITAGLVKQAAVGSGAASLFGVVLLALFMAFAAFVVWLELVVREAAVYLTVAFLPIGFAAYIWPALSSWLRRLIEVIVALILSKLVIVAALSMAGSALAAQEGFGALVGGAGMLLLAAFAPFSLFKLIPVASMATLSSLEGQGRRAVRAGTPRMSTVYYGRQIAGSAGRSRSGAASAGRAGGGAAGGGAGAAARSAGTATTAGPAAPVVAAGTAAAKVAGGAVRRSGGAAQGVARQSDRAGPPPSRPATGGPPPTRPSAPPGTGASS